MGAVETLRDALFGNPPDPNMEPSREGVLAAFTEMQQNITGIVSGIPAYATVADLPAVTAADNGKQARVYADGTAANNTFWIVDGGAWEIDASFVGALEAAIQPLVDEANSAAANAGRAAGNLSPFVTAPGAGSPLSRVAGLIQWWTEDLNGNPLTPPAHPVMRELALSTSGEIKRLRFRIANFAAPSTYVDAGAESASIYVNVAGHAGGIDYFPIYAPGTTTQIGVIPINLDDLSDFGTYAAVFSSPEADLHPVRLSRNPADVRNVQIQIDTTLGETNFESPFPAILHGSYIESIVEDVWIERGVPGRKYILNVRSDTGGAERRLQFFLYDTVRGANVAYWGNSETYDWQSEIPESIQMSGAVLGGIRPDVQYVGLTVTVFLRGANVLFNKGVTNFTDPAYALNTNRVLSIEETNDMILTGRGKRNKLRTFGTGGDFATLQDAVNSLFSRSILKQVSNNPDDIHRAWFPFSDLCTPSHQWTLRAMPGHTEVKLPVIPAGVSYARGILCWMGLTIELLNDTELKGETTGGVETYFFDFNLGGRILAPAGALIWSDGSTAVHQDAGNALSVPSAANAADPTAGLQFFQIVGLVEGGRYKSTLATFSCGVSDGQDITLRGPVLETTTAGSNNFNAHDSPNNVNPGRYTFDGVTLIGGTKSIGLVTSNPVGARHGIAACDSDITAINAANPGAYVRIGKQPGVTYSPGLEP